MSRTLTSRSSLENLRREAKRWLRQLRDGDAKAVARFTQAHPRPPRPPRAPTLRDVQLALAREYGFPGWKELAAELARRTVAESLAAEEELVARFLRWMCQDWRSDGGVRVFRMHDAARLLAQHPELARANVFTAVACGHLDYVRTLLAADARLAVQPGGPHSWPPLLYLCSARLPQREASEQAVEIAQLLLDHGADANAFYFGGNVDIHYTAFTCVMGRGEELALTHPRARELVALLLERGADPHDSQVLYNVFADNTSRHLLDDDIVWLLDLMYEHSVRRGHGALWDDPTWPMFAMRGAPSLGHEDMLHHGAHFMLSATIDRNLLGLAEWMLRHGADPNCPGGSHPWTTGRTLYQQAVAKGHMEMARLLERYGARVAAAPRDDREEFVAACMRMDVAAVHRMLAAHPEYLPDPHAIFEAIKRDRDDVAAMLLDAGMSPDVVDTNAGGVRPLHMAGAHGAEHCARLLIARGADVDARDSRYDGSPLTWASHFGQQRLIELLGNHSRDVWHLTYTGRVERLREVLRDQPHLARVTSSDGDTPLMWLPHDTAAALEIAQLLLHHGADPRPRNAGGDTAGDIAERRGLTEVATLLRRE